MVAVDVSPDRRFILTGGYDARARLLDASTGRELRVFEGHEGGVTSAAFSHDGARVVTTSNDGTARIWDAATGQAIRTFGDSVENGHSDVAADLSPDGKLLAVVVSRTSRTPLPSSPSNAGGRATWARCSR